MIAMPHIPNLIGKKFSHAGARYVVTAIGPHDMTIVRRIDHGAGRRKELWVSTAWVRMMLA